MAEQLCNIRSLVLQHGKVWRSVQLLALLKRHSIGIYQVLFKNKTPLKAQSLQVCLAPAVLSFMSNGKCAVGKEQGTVLSF